MEDLNLPSFVSSQDQRNMEDRRVGFGRRLGAKLLDGLVVIIIGVILYYTVGDMIQGELDRLVRISMMQSGQDVDSMGESSFEFASSIVKLSVIMSVSAILISLLELFTGAGPGKMLLAIRIAHADGRAGNISLWAMRWLFVNGASVLAFVGTIVGLSSLSLVANLRSFVYFFGCFLVLSQSRQALHDRLAKTAVYHDDDIIHA
ncbi:MAG: RDD family protein [Candidatus Kapaibacterium sp.]